MALAWEEGERTEETAEEALRESMRLAGINPWCGICGSPELRFEHRQTAYGSLTEALPELLAVETEQRASRAAIDALRSGILN